DCVRSRSASGAIVSGSRARTYGIKTDSTSPRQSTRRYGLRLVTPCPYLCARTARLWTALRVTSRPYRRPGEVLGGDESRNRPNGLMTIPKGRCGDRHLEPKP